MKNLVLIIVAVVFSVAAFAETETLHLKGQSSVDVCDLAVKTSKMGECKPSALDHDIRIELTERYEGRELSGFWSASQVIEGITFRNDISVFKRKSEGNYLVAISLLSYVEKAAGKNSQKKDSKSVKDSKEINEFITLSSIAKLNDLQFEGTEVEAHKKSMKPSFSVSPFVEAVAPVKK